MQPTPKKQTTPEARKRAAFEQLRGVPGVTTAAEMASTNGKPATAATTTGIVSNYSTTTNDDGKSVNVPLSMSDIIDTINARMSDWPRRVDSMLFVDDPATRSGLF